MIRVDPQQLLRFYLFTPEKGNMCMIVLSIRNIFERYAFDIRALYIFSFQKLDIPSAFSKIEQSL